MLFHKLFAPSLCALALVAGSPAFAFEPENVECIAPSQPGGGWDFTCRQVGKTLHELGLVSEPVQVNNMPGGDGGVAFSQVVTDRNEDPNLLVAASTATTSNLAQDRYVDLDADDVRWVAALGADFGTIAVSDDSPYQKLDQLIEAIKADPSQVAFSGGSVPGTWDHLKVLLVAKAAGIEDVRSIKYIAFNSGGPALTQLLGGHVQAFTGDLTEVQGQLEAGNVRILAVLAPERLPTHPDVPTAKEQGYDVIGANWRGFYLPGGISDEAYGAWVEIFEQLYNSPEWEEVMSNSGLAPFWRSGEEFEEFVATNIVELNELSKEAGVLN